MGLPDLLGHRLEKTCAAKSLWLISIGNLPSLPCESNISPLPSWIQPNYTFILYGPLRAPQIAHRAVHLTPHGCSPLKEPSVGISALIPNAWHALAVLQSGGRWHELYVTIYCGVRTYSQFRYNARFENENLFQCD